MHYPAMMRIRQHFDAPAQLDRLVGPGGIDAEGGLAVEPVVGAAQALALRADDADVVGSERLA